MRIQISDHFNLPKLLRFVLPSIIMMVFTSIYGVVDGLFVSNFAGKTAFAALNLIVPFTMVLGGVGFMVGAGGTALVAKTLGEGDKERVNKIFTMMIYLVLILGVILTAVGIIFMRDIAALLGAEGELLELSVLYGNIVVAFTVAFMLQNVFQSFLITAEKPKFGLYITVAAGVTNMVLDLLFVGIFKWGIAGAAVATGLSQCVGGIIPLIYFMRDNDSLLRFTKTGLELKPIVNACVNGSSELVNNISSSVVGMLYNVQLLRLFGEDGVSAYGVVMYVQFVFVAMFIGYSIGIAPIVGYNYGAQNHGELKNIFKKSAILTASSGLIMTALAQLCAPVLANIFVGYDAELCALTEKAFRLFSFVFIFAGMNICASGFFTALNNGLISAIISFMRTLVFQVGAVFILPILVGSDGIWSAVVVADIGAIIVSLCFLFANRKRYQYF